MASRPEANSELEDYRRMAGEVYAILQRNQPKQKPHRYSDESVRLARQLAEEVQLKLERQGRTLAQDPRTGRYTIVNLPAAPSPVAKKQVQARPSFWSRLFKR